MDKMTKEDAFAAFDEGKMPSDLKGRGLSDESLYNYYTLWKKGHEAKGSPKGSERGQEYYTTFRR